MTYDFDKFKKDELTKPRDKAWSNWAKFDKEGDKVQGFIADVFYRPAEGKFKDARGITLETPDKELVNVSIKRLPFVLTKTNDLRLGDPLTVILDEITKPKEKGLNGTKVFGFYGTNLEENKDNPTVLELDKADSEAHGLTVQEDEDDFLPADED